MNNDLISRSALKEDLRENHYFGMFTEDICNIIDNAPTVEVTDYDTGYQDGLEDGLNDIRPQGEWIFVSRNCWKCPYCQELTNEGKNFCPNCGAKMKGGAE